MDPVNGCFAMNFSGLREVITMFFLFFGTLWFNGVKNTVCLFSRPSRLPAMRPAPNMDLRPNEQSLWNTNCFQLSNSDLEWLGCAIIFHERSVEFGFTASFPDAIDPICVSEFTASILPERHHELRKYHLPMNGSMCFSEFPLVAVTVFVGSDGLPFPSMSRNVIIWRFQLKGQLFLIRVLLALVISLAKRMSGSLYRNWSTKRFGLLNMTTQTLDVEGIWILSPGWTLRWQMIFDVSETAYILGMMECFHIHHSRVSSIFIHRERSSSLTSSHGRRTGHSTSPQPFISLFTSQSSSGDLYSTALTDLNRHVSPCATTRRTTWT